MVSPQAHFTLTLNNYDTEHKDLVWNELPPHFSYFCYAKEVCPETGTPHLQAYGQTVHQKSLSSVEKILNKKRPKGSRAWRVIDPIGNSQQNCDYVSGNCEKKGYVLQEVISFGEYRELQGRRVAVDGTAVVKTSWMETFVEWAEDYTFGNDKPDRDETEVDIVNKLAKAYYGHTKKIFSSTQLKQAYFYYEEYKHRLYKIDMKKVIAASKITRAPKIHGPSLSKGIRVKSESGKWKTVHPCKDVPNNHISEPA